MGNERQTQRKSARQQTKSVKNKTKPTKAVSPSDMLQKRMGYQRSQAWMRDNPVSKAGTASMGLPVKSRVPSLGSRKLSENMPEAERDELPTLNTPPTNDSPDKEAAEQANSSQAKVREEEKGLSQKNKAEEKDQDSLTNKASSKQIDQQDSTSAEKNNSPQVDKDDSASVNKKDSEDKKAKNELNETSDPKQQDDQEEKQQGEKDGEEEKQEDGENAEKESDAKSDKPDAEQDKAAEEGEASAKEGSEKARAGQEKSEQEDKGGSASSAANATGGGSAGGVASSGGEVQVAGGEESASQEMEDLLDVEEEEGAQNNEDINQTRQEVSQFSQQASQNTGDGAFGELEPIDTSSAAIENAEENSAQDMSGSEDPATVSPEEARSIDLSLAQPVGSASKIGGGGGGSAIEKPPEPAVPKVANLSPTKALGSLKNLPPDKILAGLSGVGGAISKDVGGKRDELSNAPPKVKRPIGAPQIKQKDAKKTDLETSKDSNVTEVQEGQEQVTKAPEELPKLPKSPADNVVTPRISGGEKGEMTSHDISRMQTSIGGMPTSDPGLNMTAGDAPKVKLEGNADPNQATEQHTEFEKTKDKEVAQGKVDVAEDRGENNVFPDVDPNEELVATIPKGKAQEKSLGGAPNLGENAQAIPIVAQIHKGDEISAAATSAQGEMAKEKGKYQTTVVEEKAKNQKAIQEAERQGGEEQTKLRGQLKEQVAGERKQWSKEQEAKVKKASTESNKAYTGGLKEVDNIQKKADTDAGKEIKKGNDKAAAERKKAEAEAAKKKREAKKESKGFFSWLASKVTDFFNAIKSAIKGLFELARKAIKAAIELAKKAAVALIEAARKAIVAAIRAVGKVLIAIGNQLLKDFPALRKKFAAAINGAVEKAEKAVNAAADKLKKGVTALLDALGKALDAALSLLEKGLLAVVDVYANIVKGAIKFAEGIVNALGTFAVLIAHIASGPIRWIKNLGSSIVDGIKNHLWKAFSTAVKSWFNQKLESVLGVGKEIWTLLKNGGITLAKVGQMAWSAIKAMIPPAMISILIEKLVAMIVPAAGAVMAIIEGIQAAWGSISRIFAAIGKFITFLKQVKGGNAGKSFAEALAAAAIAVIDFVSNWLLLKLGKGLLKFGGKLKGIAKGLKKRRGKGKRKTKDRKPDKKANANKKDKKKADDKKRKRLEKAKRELPPKIRKLLAKRPSKLRLKLQLKIWKVRYRLSALEIRGSKERLRIVARVNPEGDLIEAWGLDPLDVFKIFDRIADEILASADASDLTEGGTHEVDAGVPGRLAKGLKPKTNYKIGTTTDGKDIGFMHQNAKPAFAGQAIYGMRDVRAAGSISYPTYKSRLQGVDVGDMFNKIRAGQPLPAMTEDQRGSVGALYGLWFAKEPSHPKKKNYTPYGHKRDLVYSHMARDLLTGPRKIPIAQAIDMHPAAFGGAQSGAREVTDRMQGKPGTNFQSGSKAETHYKERLRREKHIIESWFRKHQNEFPLFDRQPTIAQVEEFVRRKIQELLRR